MTLWRRILTEHRTVVIAISAVIVINVLAYALVVYPLVQRSAGAADRATAATLALRVAQREYETAQALVEGRTRAQQDLATFYDKVLPADYIAARSLTYSRPPALARETNLRYEAGAFAIDPAIKEGRVGRLQTKIVLRGDYESLRRFIYELETSQDFIIIDSVSLAQGEIGKPLTFNLELSTYYRSRTHGT